MNIDLAALPHDVDTLHRMICDLVAEQDGERVEAQAEIDRLRNIVKTLQRSQFGRRSEHLDDDQLQLALEDLDADIASAVASQPETDDEQVRNERLPPIVSIPGMHT